MNIEYNATTDLLYIRLSSEKAELTNKRVTEDIVLDIGKDNKIVGIEILDASEHVSLKELLPINYDLPKAS